MKELALLLAIMTITACATQPVADSEAVPVPAKRISDSRYAAPAPDTGTVIIKRDEGLLGSGFCLPLLIDTTEIACLRSSEILVLHVPAGDHMLAVGKRLKSNVPEIKTTIRSGDTQHFRIGVTEGGVVISPTAF